MRHPPTAQGETPRTTNDVFLGGVKLQPNFDTTKIEDQVLNIVGGTGAMHVQLCYRPQQVRKDPSFFSLSFAAHVEWPLNMLEIRSVHPLHLTRLIFYE